MLEIEEYEVLPKPVRAMARNFIKSDPNKEPQIFEVTSEEYDRLANSDDVVTQLLFWRDLHKFYAVLAGDAKRKTQTTLILKNPLYTPCAILAFFEIEEEEIPIWRKKYVKKSLNENILEME